MKKIYVYDTARNHTSQFTEQFALGVTASRTNWVSTYLPIKHYLENGIPDDANAVASLGVLRGTGLMFKEAHSKDIDWYHMDHAYFDPGYYNAGWLRITHNGHTMNSIKNCDNARYVNNFKDKVTLCEWRTKDRRGENILICPPTHATQWFFDEYEWTDRVVNTLKSYLPEDQHWRIRIRTKPNEPVVDGLGNLVRMEQNSTAEVPITQDLDAAFCVISYNSMVALQASLLGIPVVVSSANCCYPITKSLHDFSQDPYPDSYDEAPNRKALLYWLAHCQYNREELGNGFAWRHLLETQGGG